jgi:hypothetical protein
VHVDWLGRRLADLPVRTRRRIRWTREGREERRRRSRGDGSRWWDAVDLPFDSIGALVVAVVALGVLVLLWQVGVIAVLLALLELAVLVPVLVVAFTARVLLRRPWRVTAKDGSGHLRAAADVRGWRAARRLRDTWRQALADGAPLGALTVPAAIPATSRPDLVDPEAFGEVGPDELAG